MSRDHSSLPCWSIPALLALLSSMPVAHVAAQSTTEKVTKAGDKAVEQASTATRRLRGLVERAKGALAKPAGDTAAARPAPGTPAATSGAPPSASQPRATNASQGGASRAGAGASIQRGSAKVDELLVAPNEQNLAYYITPKGSHFGAVVPKGSRFAISYDGVVGPAFDRLLQVTNGVTLSFSPDGSRYAYIGETDGKYVYMVDGKEVLRIPAVTQPGVTGTMRLFFSPNGKHWYAFYANMAARDARADPQRAWWDGVPGPVGAQMDLVVSPNGERHAYTAQNPATGQQSLVVDGKLAPTLGGNPVFTSDGKHLFTTRDASPAQGRPVTELLVDGRVIVRATNVSVHVPPVGDRVVVVVARDDSPGGAGAYALVVGGQRIPGSESSGYSQVTFSPDGKRFAAISGMGGTRQRVFSDGKAGRVYDAIDSLFFSPDSKHLAYTARAGTKTFVITDDVESEIGFAPHERIIPRFSPDGRVGWLASTGQGIAVVVDGKVTQLDPRGSAFDFSFAPDGRRFAYVASGDRSGQTGGNVFVDHVSGPTSLLRDFAQYRNGDPVRYLWSPDGKYTVHYAAPGTTWGGDYGFVIGGKYLSQGNTSRIVLPTFTPDGKHLFWLVEDGQRSQMKLFLDGRAIYEYDVNGREPLKVPGGWSMGDDGSLSFFIQTVEGFKRVRVTPGTENGFEAWIAQGKALR